MLSALAVIDAAGNHVPEVRNHTSGDEQLPLGIIVDAPGIAEPVGHHFETIFGGVIAPYAAVDVGAVRFEQVFRKCLSRPKNAAFTFRFADFGGRGKAFAAIEPAIWSPSKAIGYSVRIF